MGFFDRFKNNPQPQSPGTDDDRAIARYRYLVRTAPPEAIEQAHAEAFAQLTPAQRERLLQELAAGLPEAERNAAWRAGDTAGALARSATRAELREPGTLERAWGRMDARMGAAPGSGFGAGMGGMFAGSLLGSVAGTVLGTMIAQQFFTHHPEASHLFGSDAGASPAGGGLADDPWRGLETQEANMSDDLADLGGVGDDFGSDILDV